MLWALNTSAHSVLRNDIRSLMVYTDDGWDRMPVIDLNSDEHIYIEFDQMSHDYHRYTYTINHCEPDWSLSEEIFESDYLIGINNSPIDDYELSLNTNHIYTHYTLALPNEQCAFKMSGNYLLTVYDDDDDRTPLIKARLYVVDNLMSAGFTVETNTDIDINRSHQQVKASVNFSNVRVMKPREQITITVMQNGEHGFRTDNPPADIIMADGLQWSHVRSLIFEGGNEYHKFEMLSTSHASTNVDHIKWDGRDWYASLVYDFPQPNYLYDEDADGYFLLRNSDDYESTTTSEYVYINYVVKSPYYNGYNVYVDGAWTTGDKEEYKMEYNHEAGMYYCSVLQKLGYYNYRYVMEPEGGGTRVLMPSQGSFFETQNAYDMFVYYKEIGGRTYRLAAHAASH